MWFIFILFGFLGYIYTFGVSTYKRNYSKAILRKGPREGRKVALTFDDGPHPEYTPQVLSILNQYGIAASFFVILENAEKNPHLLRRMASEGHLIGLHTYSHTHAWLMSPWDVYKDFERSIRVYQDILGYAPKWFRPPWGTFNGVTHRMANQFNLRTVYWSVEGHDWSASSTPETIAKRILDRIHPGAIIVLHDNNGAPGAPSRTLEALPVIIETLQDRGYSFVTLDKLGG